MSNILNMSIEEMHASLKEKKIKPSDLVKASIEKAKENQGTYNAFVTILEEALELSYELDNNFEEDNPLYGIPYAAKDNYSTKDILSTGSSNILNNYVPVYDATVISKLKNRKTVLIGKTTLDELAMGGTGMNTHTGPCKNPYNPQHQSGGSSGGSAAAVSLGIVPFALGSDTGDSVRKPASFCGIVGFKPTWGRISRFGVFPFAPSLDHVAYFTRTVKDSYMILENHLIMGNFSGLPSLTLPLCMSDNMPIGINITGRAFDEQTVFNISSFIESKLTFKNMIAKESK